MFQYPNAEFSNALEEKYNLLCTNRRLNVTSTHKTFFKIGNCCACRMMLNLGRIRERSITIMRWNIMLFGLSLHWTHFRENAFSQSGTICCLEWVRCRAFCCWGGSVGDRGDQFDIFYVLCQNGTPFAVKGIGWHCAMYGFKIWFCVESGLSV